MAVKAPTRKIIPELAVVALTTDRPDLGLSLGAEGTVVMVYNGGEAYEVEFIDEDRGSSTLATLRADQLKPIWIPPHPRGRNGG